MFESATHMAMLNPKGYGEVYEASPTILIYFPRLLISGFQGHCLQNSLYSTAFPGGSDGKRICLQCRRPGFDPLFEKIPWRRGWLPTPVFLPREFHGQRSLVAYSPRGCKESDTTERLTLSLDFHAWSSSVFLLDYQRSIYLSNFPRAPMAILNMPTHP